MRVWIGRTAIGLGILGCLFALAWLWDARLGRELDAARAAERSALGLLPAQDGAAVPASPARTSSILIGRPAGTATVLTTPPPATPATSASAPAVSALGAGDAATPATSTRDGAAESVAPADARRPEPGGARWRVETGQTLYSIVRKHYGRVDAALVQRVAQVNGLARAEDLRAGQTIVLPAR